MLEIHRALVQRGANVRMASHGGTHEPLLHAARVDYDIIGPHMGAERSARLVASGTGLGPGNQSMYTDDELLTYVQAEAEYFRRHATRTVVTGYTLTTLLSTRLAGATLVTEHAGSWVPPVFDRGLAPTPSMRRTQHLPRLLGRLLANRTLPRSSFYCGGFNRVAKRLGIPGVPSLASLVMGDLTLIPEIPEVLGIPAEQLEAWTPAPRAAYRPGARLRYTGPLYAHLDVDLPNQVAAFLDQPGPIIYVAITSSPPGLIRDVVQSLRSLRARLLIAGTVHDLADLADERTCVGGVLPAHLVMPRVTVAVISGGQGSVQTAMAAGTPVLGIPLQPEQDLNLALLQRRGAAIAIAPRHARSPRLTRAAENLLTQRPYAEAAARIRDLYAAVDGPANAADAILEVTGRRPGLDR
jgi:UDP:flavonoid glycosyltransferase YjiC (YdhE family)